MIKTRHDEMREQVKKFHLQNPIVWDLFKIFTFEVIDRGFKNYSVNAIFERIRWEQDIMGDKATDTFKLNNNYRAFYARRFMATFTEHDGFFRIRKQISGEQKATNLPELTPSYMDRQFSNQPIADY
tara:strand:- start:272 stop:652 length:381 start_codon:yes stop_codon:yes gene_type:complete